jgi:HEAT repeat protein
MMQWHSIDHQTNAHRLRLRVRRLFQFRLSRLMVLVAIVAVLFSAWLFNREYRNSQHGWTSSQIAALGDGDPARRRQAAENLSIVEMDDLGRTVSVLAGAMADPDWQVRQAAARSLAMAIGSLGGITNGELIKHIDLAARALIPACDDPRDEVRVRAIQALGKLYDTPPIPRSAWTTNNARSATGAEAHRASDTLSSAMQDSRAPVRAQAVWSFARTGRVSGAVADPVKEMVESDPERKVRIAALEALRVGWPNDPSLCQFLLRRLKVVGDQEERSHVALAIGALGPPPAEALPALLDALSSEEWAIRHYIPIMLGKLGPAACPALPALARLARAELADQHGRGEAVDAIRSIDPNSPEAQALIEPLAILLRDSPSEFQRQKAMFQLVGFGSSAAVAVGPLRDALKSAKPDVKQRAILVLGYMGPAAKSAIADLDRLMRHDPDLSVRHAAEESVTRIKASPINPSASRDQVR